MTRLMGDMVNISTVGFIKEGNIAQGISSKIVKWSIMEVATPHYGGCQPILCFCSYKRLFTLLKSSPKVVCSHGSLLLMNFQLIIVKDPYITLFDGQIILNPSNIQVSIKRCSGKTGLRLLTQKVFSKVHTFHYQMA